MLLAKIRAIAEDASRGRPAAGEQRRARRIAQRELAIIAIESHSRFREGVNIRRPRAKTARVAPEFHAHVIGHQKKHVRLASRFGNLRAQSPGQCRRRSRSGDGSQKLAARPMAWARRTHAKIVTLHRLRWQDAPTANSGDGSCPLENNRLNWGKYTTPETAKGHGSMRTLDYIFSKGAGRFVL
jgi:hypothetical protein